jgi:hypothetical protein
LIALLDSGSTHNFIDVKAASRAGITLGGRSGMRVVVANGDQLQSPRSCRGLPVSIGDEQFTIDCYGLALGSYHMVLGVQWLESLGPILWDFGLRTIQFIRGGHRACWSSSETDTTPPTLLQLEGNIMDDLLGGFQQLFIELAGLPPHRSHCHRIQLLLGTAPIAVRPYRYMHAQKEELERQCTLMLQHVIIRPSTSAFSAPVLLVKKCGGTWRFCVDYRALNSKTVKDKFPIPVVEELLDELRGTKFFTKLDLRSGYHQVLMNEDDIELTAFRTHQGLFEFLVMPFGFTNAPATFQALMNDILRPYLRWFVLVFFDDILIFSSSWSEHLRRVQVVLSTLQEHNLFVKKSKCKFRASSVA